MSVTYNKGKLKIVIADNREQLGEMAAKDGAEILKELLSSKDEINVMFAAAPSQDETLRFLLKDEDIEWDRVNAFHMDEYVGVGLDTEQSFAHYLNLHIFSKTTFKKIFYICCEDDYASLIKSYHIDVVFLGIGENGHIAFNDPDVADFNDKEIIKKVTLDPICREQQVHDGCFETIEKVPLQAYTVTIPPILDADYLICSVPGERKANAVFETINNPINEKCPSTILRKHKHATLYLDLESSKLLTKEQDDN